VELARRLVATPSVVRPGDPAGTESAAAAVVASALQALGLEVRLEEAAPGRPNVIADWSGSGAGPLLILEGHTDVVTEGDPSLWSVPPFGAVVRGGRLYGRGAADMKGGLAAAIGALAALGRAGVRLAGRVRFAAVADEEGMMLGIKSFVRNGWAEGAIGAIVCEPEANAPCLVQKGGLRAAGRFRGRMAHGAMPASGVNPIPAAAAFVRRAAALERDYIARGRHVLLGAPSVTPTVVRAGDLVHLNVVPQEALVALDVRTIPGQSHEEIVRDLERAAADAAGATPGCRGALDVIEERPWTETPPDALIAQAVERACRLVQGRDPERRGVPGSTDGTFLHAWAGVPVVTIGPGDVTIPHQVDEFVRLDELVEAARIFAAAVCFGLSGRP
jgi:succinyl-diaminopimelate desuccinylase